MKTTLPSYPNEPLGEEKSQLVANLLEALVRAYAAGLVVTVDLEPLRPLAMGNYEPHVHVRHKIDHKAEAAKRGGYSL
jgi:hypothetical protein